MLDAPTITNLIISTIVSLLGAWVFLLLIFVISLSIYSPKATNYKGTINAELCDKLLDGKLKTFFDKYPNQLSNGVEMFLDGTTNISEDEASFFEKELRGDEFYGIT